MRSQDKEFLGAVKVDQALANIGQRLVVRRDNSSQKRDGFDQAPGLLVCPPPGEIEEMHIMRYDFSLNKSAVVAALALSIVNCGRADECVPIEKIGVRGQELRTRLQFRADKEKRPRQRRSPAATTHGWRRR